MLDLQTLTIIHYPDPRLRKVCEPIASFNGALADLSRRMFELMYEAKGLGLAASQVGVLRQLFVCNPTGEPGDERVFVNPTLVCHGPDAEHEEGCLSIPEVYGDVLRSERVTLQAQDLTGQTVEVKADDLLSRCFQHEIDHLNGVLIVDRMSEAGLLANRRALRYLEQASQRNR
jgi:peptide deformylase